MRLLRFCCLASCQNRAACENSRPVDCRRFPQNTGFTSSAQRPASPRCQITP
jgi:hypothetical protein